MQVDNYPTANDLSEMTAQSVAELPTSVLSTMQSSIEDDLSEIKSRKDVLDQALVIKYGDSINATFLADGRDTGKAHIMDDGIGIEVDVPKNVSWEQGGLRKALDQMTPDRARHYGKIKIEVAESKFSSAEPDIKAILAPLRTVKPGKMKIKFEQCEGKS